MFIIQEIQTTNGQTALTPAVVKPTREEADSVFYSLLSYAAISTVGIHAVVMFDEHGNVLNVGRYEHLAE